jgi:hypothetical protein
MIACRGRRLGRLDEKGARITPSKNNDFLIPSRLIARSNGPRLIKLRLTAGVFSILEGASRGRDQMEKRGSNSF